MPYNTTAIPPRKEVTGQTQLPLTRVKKIIAVDPDIAICSNNAAFVITLATELFIQHFVTEGQNMAKTERKPRRNIQYKDLANAVSHHDNLEFLEDVIPKTTPYKQIKAQAAATRAKLKGEKSAGAAEGDHDVSEQPNGKKQKSTVNGTGGGSSTNGVSRQSLLSEGDPSSQLELEMRQAQRAAPGDGDVDMIG
ncbi:histone-fold-containing protein [Cercophora newfieldiana]|uniref:Histone-fold-containing protein n=1 Tax=Cercophora newfieldiana TaxID=92897 RepID=A0AA40CKC4_9PEZI|nr:histone-fold-containing protein [Cercophora newfieldiana]